MAFTMLARLFILLQLQMVALEKGSSADNPAYYNIGGVLTTNASLDHFSTTIAVSKRNLNLIFIMTVLQIMGSTYTSNSHQYDNSYLTDLCNNVL